MSCNKCELLLSSHQFTNLHHPKCRGNYHWGGELFNATWPQSFPHGEKKKNFLLCLNLLSSAEFHETKSYEQIEKFRFLILLIVKRDWEKNFFCWGRSFTIWGLVDIIFLTLVHWNELRFMNSRLNCRSWKLLKLITFTYLMRIWFRSFVAVVATAFGER